MLDEVVAFLSSVLCDSGVVLHECCGRLAIDWASCAESCSTCLYFAPELVNGTWLGHTRSLLRALGSWMLNSARSCALGTASLFTGSSAAIPRRTDSTRDLEAQPLVDARFPSGPD